MGFNFFSLKKSSWTLQLLIALLMSAFWIPFIFSAFSYREQSWFGYLLFSRLILAAIPIMTMIVIMARRSIIPNFESWYYLLACVVQASHGICEGQKHLDFYQYTSLFFFISSISYQGSFGFWFKRYFPIALLAHIVPLFFKSSVYYSSFGSSVDSFSFNVAFSIFSLISIYIADNRFRVYEEKIELEKKLLQERDNRLSLINQELEKAREKIAEDSKMIAIASTVQLVAHDLRGPLAIVDKVTRAKDYQEFEQIRPALQSAFYRMQNMANAFRKADLELLIKPDWHIVPWDSIIEEFNIISRGQGVTLSLKDEVNNEVKVDLPKLERAITNLLKNALDADADQITIKCWSHMRDLTISVIDNGPGVPENFVNKLFVRGETLGKKEGTGLGLHYVQKVARGHGGDATYQRSEGHTIFSIILPNALHPAETTGRLISNTTDNGENVSDIKSIESPLRPNISQVIVNLEDKTFEGDLIDALQKRFMSLQITNSDQSMGSHSLLYTNVAESLAQALQLKVSVIYTNGMETANRAILKIEQKLL